MFAAGNSETSEARQTGHLFSMRIYITDSEQRIEIHHVNPNSAYISAAVNSDHLYLHFLNEKQLSLPKLLQKSPFNAKIKKKKKPVNAWNYL